LFGYDTGVISGSFFNFNTTNHSFFIKLYKIHRFSKFIHTHVSEFISGALLYLKIDFELSDWQQEFVVSAALVGDYNNTRFVCF
jgi:hypothetical protein